MFNPLCLLLAATIYWQNVASRHLLQESFYSPYSEYSYSYPGAIPYQPHFQQQSYHSPLFSPPGTYFDQRRGGVLRPFPGGGIPLKVDYHNRCPNQYVGLKAHPDQKQYYKVCKPDCVIFGKCQNLQIFNSTCGQCVQHPPPEYIPTCIGVGRFPLFSDCHLYYKCEEDLQPKIYSCPGSMIFSSASKNCVDGNKCTTTQISPHSSYIPEYCASNFPPCFENGTFRSPTDCSLYYKCDLKNNGIYIQTRLRCPQGNFYDLQTNECLPASDVPCDCIQVAELVYPKPNHIPFGPEVYPTQFDMASLEENHYPVEHTIEEINNNCNISESINDENDTEAAITTLVPTTLETTLDNEEDFLHPEVLSDWLNIGLKKKSSFRKLIADLSSQEETTTEGSGVEVDSEESTTLQPDNKTTEQSKNEATSTLPNVTEMEEVDETASTNDVTKEPQKTSTEGPIITTDNEIQTTNTPEEETTSARILDNSAATPFREDMVENYESKDRLLTEDTHTSNTSQTQNKKRLPKITTSSINTDSEQTKTTVISDITRESRSTVHEQNSTTITAVSNLISTQLPTTKLTHASDNLETTQLPNEPILFPEKDNILIGTGLVAAETTESSENTATVQASRSPDPDTGKPQNDGNIIITTLKTIPEDTTQTIHTYSVDASAMESYNSSEDADLTSASLHETTKGPLVETTNSPHRTELKVESEISREGDSATTQSHLHVQSTQIPLRNKNVQEVANTIKSEITTVKSDASATTLKPPSNVTTAKPSKDSEDKIDDFETLTQSTENLNGNSHLDKEQKSSNEKTETLRHDDFRDEEFKPVANELPDPTTDFNFISENTTILADKNVTTSAAIVATESTQQQEQKAETVQVLEKETKNDDQFTRNTSGRQTFTDKTDSSAPTTEQPNTKTTSSATIKAQEDLAVIHGPSEEVSNNEITSAETIPTSNLKQQIPLTPTITFTPKQTSNNYTQIYNQHHP